MHRQIPFVSPRGLVSPHGRPVFGRRAAAAASVFADALEELLAGMAANEWKQINNPNMATAGNPLVVAAPRTLAVYDGLRIYGAELGLSGSTFASDAAVATTAALGGIGGENLRELNSYSNPTISAHTGLVVMCAGGGHSASGRSGLIVLDTLAAAAAVNAGGYGVCELKKGPGTVIPIADGKPAISPQITSAGNYFYNYKNVAGDLMPMSTHRYHMGFMVADPVLGYDVYYHGGFSGYASDSLSRIGGVWRYDPVLDTIEMYYTGTNTVGGLGLGPTEAFAWPVVYEPTLDKVFCAQSGGNAFIRWDDPRGASGDPSLVVVGSPGTSRAGVGAKGLIITDPANPAKVAFWCHNHDVGSSHGQFKLVQNLDATATFSKPNYATDPTTIFTYHEGTNGEYLNTRSFCWDGAAIVAFEGEGRLLKITPSATLTAWTIDEWLSVASSTGDLPPGVSTGGDHYNIEHLVNYDTATHKHYLVAGQKNPDFYVGVVKMAI